MIPRVAIPIPNSKDSKYVMRALPQYEHAVREAGGEPVILDIGATSNEIAQKAKTCDGVLLPGSPADVDPEKYNATRHSKTAAADVLRDNTDELLLQDAYNMRKPILGICYGMQSLNVWRGGTLVQHLETGVNHEAGRNVTDAHVVEVDPGSPLAKILGQPDKNSTTVTINSSHHQSVDILGDGLRLVATSPTDHVKEAIEGTADDHFVLCVQWHPERTYDHDPVSRALFKAFILAAAEWHKKLALKQKDFESVPGQR
jgi:putative glutamine amidotransferase